MSDNKKSSISKRSSCYLLNLKQPDKTARRLKLSFQRTSASVKLVKSDRNVDAIVGFLDVSETGAGVYTPELLHKGSLVELLISEPASMRVRGIVAWSIPVISGIHAGKFRCRSGIQFVFESESQAESLREFVVRAAQDPIEQIRNTKPVSAAEAAILADMAGAFDPASAVAPAVPADAAAPIAAEVAASVIETAPAIEVAAGEAPQVATESPAPVLDATPVPEASPSSEIAAAPELVVVPEALGASIAPAEAPSAEAAETPAVVANPVEEPKAA
jgi:hypothetical protein